MQRIQRVLSSFACASITHALAGAQNEQSLICGQVTCLQKKKVPGRSPLLARSVDQGREEEMTMTDFTKDRFTLGDASVARMGYGAMQLAGPRVFGPPKDPQEC